MPTSAHRAPVALGGPTNGGSPPPRPRLVAEDLLLYDRDGGSLLDDHALRILIALHQESLTAQAIAARYRVPIAACYRRVRRLVSLGLISEAGFVTEGRRRPARLYKSEVDRFQIMYGSGRMHLSLILRNGTETKTVVGIPPDIVVSGTTAPPPHEIGGYSSA
jgi:DNA-binding Lrp family transcriptional regulator